MKLGHTESVFLIYSSSGQAALSSCYSDETLPERLQPYESTDLATLVNEKLEKTARHAGNTGNK